MSGNTYTEDQELSCIQNLVLSGQVIIEVIEQ